MVSPGSRRSNMARSSPTGKPGPSGKNMGNTAGNVTSPNATSVLPNLPR